MTNIVVNIVNEIPEILSYFIPGFIFLKLFSFYNSKAINNFNLTLIWIVVISYLVKGFVNICDAIILPELKFLPWAEFLCYVFVAIVLAYLINAVYNSRFFRRYVERFNHKSTNEDIWKDVIDYDLGTSLKVFLKDETIYIGKLAMHEEKGNASWFIFSEYIAIYPDGEEYNSLDAAYPTMAAINLQEVKRIELYYNENTSIFN